MCLIVFAWRPDHPQPLVLAANRDEFYPRPCLPLARWPEPTPIVAGRDLQAGGSWLGLGPGGRFAALTNIRDPRQVLGGPSRGELVADFLRSQASPAEYLKELAPRAQDYAGFNLLLGTAQELWHFNPRRGAAQQLPPGLYGVSNADLDSPWPKLLRAKAALEQQLDHPEPSALLSLLADRQRPEDAQLPHTGVSLEVERLLSSIFIASPGYGTRASTALIVQQDGSRQIHERSFGPDGVLLGDVSLLLEPTPQA